MADKRIKTKVMITIPSELNKRWNAVAKKHHLVKGWMVEDFLNSVIPILEKENEKSIVETAIETSKKLEGKLSKMYEDEMR